ncbi:MAG: hypothetical protein ACRCZO_18700, partial [Cetobacterium sp.]
GTGELKKCYSSIENQNIFEDISKEISFEAIGTVECKPYCINSSHFLSLGVIPNLKTPTYLELRSRQEENLYSKKMRYFLSSKLSESNSEYSFLKKIKIDLRLKKNNSKKKVYLSYTYCRRIMKNIIKNSFMGE